MVLMKEAKIDKKAESVKAESKAYIIKLRLMSYLYEQVKLKPTPQNKILKLAQLVYEYIYRLIRKFDDPLVKLKIGDKYLYMNASHKLPRVKRYFPYYDTALPILCRLIEQKQGHLTFIDVGANIGDTVSLITDQVMGNFLCIEPNPHFFELLQINIKNIPNVICEKTLVSEKEEISKGSLIVAGGTARMISSTSDAQENSLQTTTVDKLVEKHPLFAQTNLLKIDTDGYDYKIIRGCNRLLTESKPAIFFELHPYFLKSVGEDPISIFDYLSERGYTKALFYDNIGYPLILISTNESELISQLIDYASIKNNFYYDVLLFHDLCQEDFQDFCQSEFMRFPKVEWF